MDASHVLHRLLSPPLPEPGIGRIAFGFCICPILRRQKSNWSVSRGCSSLASGCFLKQRRPTGNDFSNPLLNKLRYCNISMQLRLVQSFTPGLPSYPDAMCLLLKVRIARLGQPYGYRRSSTSIATATYPQAGTHLEATNSYDPATHEADQHLIWTTVPSTGPSDGECLL